MVWKNFCSKFFSENVSVYEMCEKNIFVQKKFSENGAVYEMVWKNIFC